MINKGNKMKPLHIEITKEKLHSICTYDKLTGIFIFNNKNNSIHKSNNGYLKFSISGKSYLLHRLAWIYEFGTCPDVQIDHINHIRDDNRIENLRLATHKENGRNQKIRSTNKSGTTGVYFDKQKKKWRAQIMIDGKCLYLGSYYNKSDAISSRKEANKKYNFHTNHGY